MAANELIPWINSAGEGGVRNSMQEYPGTGTNGPFEFNFAGGYIDPSHVKAYWYDPVTAMTIPQTLTFVGPNQVKTADVIPTGHFLVVYRDTPKDRPLVDYSEGAVMDEANLDKSNDQNVFIAAEMLDRFDAVNATSSDAIERSVLAYNTANKALDNSREAQANAINATAEAHTASNNATNAVNTANDAHTIATGIDGKAQSALDASANAMALSKYAVDTANGIDGKATKAMSDAAAAVTTANSAASDASTALSAANSVSGKADNAVATANDAATKANNAYQKQGGDIGPNEAVQTTTSGNGWRLINGNYGIFLRNDGTTASLMQTNPGDQRGSYNSFRPFSWNLGTGTMTIDGHGAGITTGGSLSVGRDISAKGDIYANNGNVHIGSDGNLYGSMWGGWLSNVIVRRRNGTATGGYVIIDSNNTLTLNWDGRVRAFVDGQNQGAIYTDAIFNIGDYAPRSMVDSNWFRTVHSNGANNHEHSWDGGARHINICIDGNPVAYIAANWSDMRLKMNITDTAEDSLAKVKALKFKQFDWRDSGAHQKLGLIAQQAKLIDPDFVYQPPGDTLDPDKSPMMFDQHALLFAALHSIQQLSARVEALESALK